jgi:hypothetical protein
MDTDDDSAWHSLGRDAWRVLGDVNRKRKERQARETAVPAAVAAVREEVFTADLNTGADVCPRETQPVGRRGSEH